MAGFSRRHDPVAAPRRDSDAATREDLRALRRWIAVAGVWAVAATAIALIALLDNSGGDARREAERATGRIAVTERKLDRRIDIFERRLDDLPRSEDVSKLQERLSKAETGASKAATDARSVGEKLTALEKRVQTVEDDAAGADDPADPDAEP